MAVILGGLLWPLACAPSGRLRRPVRRTASRNATGGLRQVLLWRSGDGEGGQRRLQRWRVANDGQVQLVAGAGEMSEASALVDAILAEVDGTDGGVNISIKSKEKVDAMLEKLEEIGAKQVRSHLHPLHSPPSPPNCEYYSLLPFHHFRPSTSTLSFIVSCSSYAFSPLSFYIAISFPFMSSSSFFL